MKKIVNPLALALTIVVAMIFILSPLASFSAFASKGKSVEADGKDEEGIFIRTAVSSSKTVVGSMVLYEVAVISPTTDISILESPSHLNWGGLSVKRVAADSEFSIVDIKGKKHYKAVIARYWVTASEPGRFSIPGGEYVIGQVKERIVRDPFWGNMRSSYYEPVNLNAPSLSLKVETLPSVPTGFPFSGAVGDFDVSVWIPEGYISAGQDAIAIVSITGQGDLSEVEIPSVQEAFGAQARFKSLSVEKTNFVKDGKLCSEMELEVTFVPHPDGDGNCTIGGVTFGYYSPTASKFLKTTSDPVDVPIGSRKRESSAPAVGV